MANRHLSRSVVLQSLFEWDFSKDPESAVAGGHSKETISDILKRNAEEFAPGMGDNEFMNNLAEGIVKKQPEIDMIITKAAPEWPIEKISPIDRNVLRLGLYELIYSNRDEVPAKVAINEAIELAKTFGGENSGKFVNGVLGSVYKELGEPGKDSPPRSKDKDGKRVDIKKLPIDKLAGAIVYARQGTDIYLALVHDIFGHWTLSKGHIKEGEADDAGLRRIVAEEMGLSDITIKDELGGNEYIASDPEKGKLKKQVRYFLCSSAFDELKLGKKGGLDDAQWFRLADILELNFYNDILPVVTKAINILAGNKV